MYNGCENLHNEIIRGDRMTFNLEVGMTGRVDLKVEDKHSAANFGSGNVDVFSTPMMVGLMENAAHATVDPKLPEGHATVGIHLDVKHMAATPIGMNVYAVAELIKVEGKKLTFTIEAFDDEEKIGEGTHQRYIIALDSLLEATAKKKERNRK